MNVELEDPQTKHKCGLCGGNMAVTSLAHLRDDLKNVALMGCKNPFCTQSVMHVINVMSKHIYDAELEEA